LLPYAKKHQPDLKEPSMKTVDMTDVWEVQVSAGVLETMTLDELDAAFQGGRITEQTFVREHGTEVWSTLAIVAGIDSAPEPIPSMPNSMAPVVADLYDGVPLSYIPQLKPMFAAPPKPDFDLDLDFDSAVAFKTSKKKTVAVALGIAAAVASLLGLIIVSAGSSDGSEANKSAAAAPIAAAVSLPAAASPIPAAGEAVGRLSEEQRRALLDADKKRIDPRKPRAGAGGSDSPPPQRTSGKRVSAGNVFHKGGNEFDPLNTNL
jgi:hypothetical protein